MDNLTKKDKIVFGILFVIIAVFFSYIVYTRILGNNIGYDVKTYNFDSAAYDVEVINSASYDDFLAVKGIGEAKATAIVEYREALGGFDSVYQLQDLNSISDSLFDTILDHFYGENDSEAEPEVTSVSVTDSTESTAEITASVSSESAVSSSVTEYSEASESYTTISEEPEEPDEVEIIEDEVIEDVPVMTSVEINYATAEEISRCLLIDISLAEDIVQLRQKIGGFSNVRELTLCENLTTEVYKIISKFIIIS